MMINKYKLLIIYNIMVGALYDLLIIVNSI